MPYYWIITDEKTDRVIEVELTTPDTEPPYSDDTDINQYLIETDEPPVVNSIYKP